MTGEGTACLQLRAEPICLPWVVMSFSLGRHDGGVGQSAVWKLPLIWLGDCGNIRLGMVRVEV